MPVSVEYCSVCGTLNPFYAVWKESEGSDSAAPAGAQSPVVAGEEEPEAPIDFDFSALFGTQSQEEAAPEAVPQSQGGEAPALDLASLFTWGEPETDSAETPPLADTISDIEPAAAPAPADLTAEGGSEVEADALTATEPTSDSDIEAELDVDIETAPEPLVTLPAEDETSVAQVEPQETSTASVEVTTTSDDESSQLAALAPDDFESGQEPPTVEESKEVVEETPPLSEEPSVTAAVAEEVEPSETLTFASSDEFEPELSASPPGQESGEVIEYAEPDEQPAVEIVATLAEEQEESPAPPSEELIDAEDTQLAWEPSPEDSSEESVEEESLAVPEPEEDIPPVLAAESEPESESIEALSTEEETVEQPIADHTLTEGEPGVGAASMEAESALASVGDALAAEEGQAVSDDEPEEVATEAQVESVEPETAPEMNDTLREIEEFPSALEASQVETDEVAGVEEVDDTQLALETSPPQQEREELTEQAGESVVIEQAETVVAEQPVPTAEAVSADMDGEISAAAEEVEEPTPQYEETTASEIAQPAVEIETEGQASEAAAVEEEPEELTAIEDADAQVDTQEGSAQVSLESTSGELEAEQTDADIDSPVEVEGKTVIEEVEAEPVEASPISEVEAVEPAAIESLQAMEEESAAQLIETASSDLAPAITVPDILSEDEAEEPPVEPEVSEAEGAEEPAAVPAPMPISAEDAPLAALSPAEAIATVSHDDVLETEEAAIEDEASPATAPENELQGEEAVFAEPYSEEATASVAEQTSQEALPESTGGNETPQESVPLALEPAPEAELPSARAQEPVGQPALPSPEEPIGEPEPAPVGHLQLRSRLNVIVQPQPPATAEPEQPLPAAGDYSPLPAQVELTDEHMSAPPPAQEALREAARMESAEPETGEASELAYQAAGEEPVPDMLVIAPRLTISGTSLSAVVSEPPAPTPLPVSGLSAPLPVAEITDRPAPVATESVVPPQPELMRAGHPVIDAAQPEVDEQPESAAVPAPGGVEYAHPHPPEPPVDTTTSDEAAAQADAHQEEAQITEVPPVEMASAPAHEVPGMEEEPIFDLSSLWSDVEIDEEEEAEAEAASSSPLPESESTPPWEDAKIQASHEAGESFDSQVEEAAPVPLQSPFFYSVSPSPQPTQEDATADYLPTFSPSSQDELPATTLEPVASIAEAPGEGPLPVVEESQLLVQEQAAPAQSVQLSEVVGAGGAIDHESAAEPASQPVLEDAPPSQPAPLPLTIPSAAPPTALQYEEHLPMPDTPGIADPNQPQALPEVTAAPVPISQAEAGPPLPSSTGVPYVEPQVQMQVQMQPQGSMPPTYYEAQVAEAHAAPEHLDLSALFDGMEIDTSEPDLPPPAIQASSVEAPAPAAQTAQTAAPTPQPSPPPAPVMPMTIKPSGPARWPTPPPAQPAAQSPQDVASAAAADSQAWKAFAGLASAESANQPLPQHSGQGGQYGTPQPQYPQAQPQAPAWQPGQPRPQPGTPEYDAMVKSALAQRGAPASQPTQPQPQYQPPQPQYPQAQPQAPAWQPGQPRPQPGTPEYDAMVQAALAQRGVNSGPITSPQPQQPYSQPSYPQAQPQAPAWQPGQPRPQPGTPEYEEMVRAALAQRGVSSAPLASTPQPQQPQGGQAPAWQPGQPRPKPGTPEYDEMVRRALEERRQREGR
jgi:hypothetical protein